VVACILAGGQSSRLGKDKTRVRLGRRTLLGHIRTAVSAAGLRAKVQRRDIVPRCGPIGGMYTALKSVTAPAVLFLACDMAFVSPELLVELVATHRRTGRPVFVEQRRRRGFPCIVRRSDLGKIGQLIAAKEWSIQALSRALRAGVFRLPPSRASELLNVNTPEDLALARQFMEGSWHLTCKTGL
jgi:molybdopterin-guanine dinucleotide biosynthesis protein A